MATRADLMTTNARALIGNGYAWGATGQKCSQAVLEQLARQYPEQTNLLKVCPKWIGKRIYDCATFVAACLRAAGITICNGATSQWRGNYWEVKGEIGDMPRDRPCILYYTKDGGATMQHTGVYLGGGRVIDARGSAQGVIESELASRVWTHYAVPRGLYEAIAMLAAIVTATSGSSVRMRRFASTSSGVVRKVPIGEQLTITEHRADWCAVIGRDGHSGFMMTEFLAFQGQGVEAPTYTVQLFDASDAERGAIVAACPRVKVEQNVG